MSNYNIYSFDTIELWNTLFGHPIEITQNSIEYLIPAIKETAIKARYNSSADELFADHLEDISEALEFIIAEHASDAIELLRTATGSMISMPIYKTTDEEDDFDISFALNNIENFEKTLRHCANTASTGKDDHALRKLASTIETMIVKFDKLND